MKVTLNKNIILQLNKPLFEEENTSNVSDEMENAYFHKYLQEKKRDFLTVDIKMPTTIATNLLIPPCPIDIANLMRTFDKSGKFKNINDMTEDPVKTFNHAEDLAKSNFAKLTNLHADIVNTEEGKKTDNVADSYNYNGIYNKINEESEIASSNIVCPLVSKIFGHSSGAVGTTIGSGVGHIANALTDVTLTTCGSFFVVTATRAASIYGLGYTLLKCFGDVTGDATGRFNSNNDELTQGNKKIDDNSDENSDKNWHGTNAVEAINSYISSLKTSVGNVVAQISPAPEKYTDFANKINDYISSEDKALNEYLNANNAIAKKVKEELEAEVNNRVQKKNIINEQIIEFHNKLLNLMTILSNDPNFLKTLKLIINKYESYIKGTADKKKIAYVMENELDAGNLTKLKNLAGVSDTTSSPVSNKTDDTKEESINNQFDTNTEALFEEETVEAKPKLIDATKLYNNIKNELSKSMEEMFPLGQGSKIPGYEDSKTLMTKMITSATTEITGKITTICNSYNDGKEEKIPEKIKGFFVHHPMQAKTLTRLWENHETELNMRMNRRLKQMVDFGNTTRIVGWTVTVCKNVIPEIFARMFVYRYVLSVLKEEGYYNFNPLSAKLVEKEWSENKELYMKEQNSKLLWLLKQIGNDYASIKGDNDYIVYDKNSGEFSIKAPMHFATLLLFNIYVDVNDEQKSDMYKIISNSLVIANETDIYQLCKNINIITGGIDDVEEARDILYYGDKYEKSKQLIYDTYEKIIKRGQNLQVDNVNMTAAYNFLVNNDLAFKTYLDNKQHIITAYESYKSATDEKEKNDALGKVKEIIRDLAGGKVYNINLDDLNNVLPFDEVFKAPNIEGVDYYAYIYSIYLTLIEKIYKILSSESVNNPTTIEEICYTTLDFVELITSGILNVGQEISNFDTEINLICRAINEYIEQTENASPEDYLALLEYTYEQLGGDKNTFEKMYSGITENDAIKNTLMNALKDSKEALSYDFSDANLETMPNPNGFTGFDSLKISDFITNNKANNLYDFIKDSTDEIYKTNNKTTEDDINRFKNAIKYLIEYSICYNISTNSDDYIKLLYEKCIFNKSIYEYMQEYIANINSFENYNCPDAEFVDKFNNIVNEMNTQFISLFLVHNEDKRILLPEQIHDENTLTYLSECISLTKVNDNVEHIFNIFSGFALSTDNSLMFKDCNLSEKNKVIKAIYDTFKYINDNKEANTISFYTFNSATRQNP